MNWTKVLEFIDATDPSFAAKMQGAPPKDLAACEAGLGISLPDSYRQFLMTMGVSSGDFHPFGATQTHDFYELLEQLTDDDYPTDRFFRVSFASDESQISPPDYFLDLARSDGDDAPIVMFEGGFGFKAEHVRDTGFTFAEHITDKVFRYFELDLQMVQERILVSDVSPAEAPHQMTIALDLLTTMGFELVLPRVRRVACLRRGAASALLSVSEPLVLVKINVGSGDPKELRVVVDQILNRVPGAEVFPSGA